MPGFHGSPAVFRNIQIAADELPKVADVEWLGMDPRYRLKLLVAGAIAFALVIAGLAGLHTILAIAFRAEEIDVPLALMWLALPPVAVILLAWPYRAVPRMGYAVRERDLLYRSGVLWRKVTAIPFNRIQHVEKDTSPLDRRLQLANLKIFTAGGAGGDLKIHGLSDDVAERVRGFLLDRIGTSVEQP